MSSCTLTLLASPPSLSSSESLLNTIWSVVSLFSLEPPNRSSNVLDGSCLLVVVTVSSSSESDLSSLLAALELLLAPPESGDSRSIQGFRAAFLDFGPGLYLEGVTSRAAFFSRGSSSSSSTRGLRPLFGPFLPLSLPLFSNDFLDAFVALSVVPCISFL